MSHSFKDLRISWKLLISSLLFLIPTVVMFSFFLTGVNASLRFSTLELLGNQFQAPLEQVYYSLMSFEESRSVQAAQDVTAGLKVFASLEDSLGSELRLEAYTGAKSQALEKAWAALRAEPSPGRFDRFFGDLSALTTYIGNQSNLILDPDLDSYYLMDVTLLALPQSEARLRDIRNFGDRELALPGPNVVGQVRSAVLAALLDQSDLQRVVSSSRTAIAEDSRFSGANQDLQQTLGPALDQYHRSTEALVGLLSRMGDPQGLPPNRAEFRGACAAARDAAHRYWATSRAILDQLLTKRVEGYQLTRIFGVGLTALTLLLAGWIVFLISRNVSRSIGRTLEFAESLAEGDLVAVQGLDQSDEVGTLGRRLETLRDNLHGILRNEIRSTVQVLAESTVHLTASSQDIAASSNQQAAAVKEIVSTMEDSDRLSQGVAEKVNQVAVLAEDTRKRVHSGFGMVTANQAAMSEIRETTDQTILGIRSLGAKIANIQSIVDIINGITSQTKIIAFNAELEAASAGEAGKNFEIVATEIRRLADKSGSATSEIRDLLSEVQRASQELLDFSTTGTQKVALGLDLSAQVENLFADILTAADQSAGSAGQIAALIQRQVEAFGQILLTLRQISEGIDRFTGNTRSTRQSAEELKKMSDDLEAILQKFRLDAGVPSA